MAICKSCLCVSADISACVHVNVCVLSLSTASWSSLWSRWCFCWLIPASPHACLTTQSSSLLASCPNQFICKQVCFFPLRPIVHTTPECIHNGRPLSHRLLLYCKVENIMFFTTTRSYSAKKLHASYKYKVLKRRYRERKKLNVSVILSRFFIGK